jgi:hypothetical protein
VSRSGRCRIEQRGKSAAGRYSLRRHAEHRRGMLAPVQAIVGDRPFIGDATDTGEDGARCDWLSPDLCHAMASSADSAGRQFSPADP